MRLVYNAWHAGHAAPCATTIHVVAAAGHESMMVDPPHSGNQYSMVGSHAFSWEMNGWACG